MFTDKLFGTTSSHFAPSPPREPTPPRKPSKGKGVATEEPMKELIPFIEEGGSDPKILNVKSFVTLEGELSKEELMVQLKAQAKKLAEYEQKKGKMLDEYNKCINERVDPLPITKINYRVISSHDAIMRITRGHDPLNVMVYEKFRLKTLGFSEWLEVQALASKTSSRLNDMLLQSLRAKFNWVISQAKKLGIPPPPELAHFGKPTVDKKRKRTEIQQEVFVKENIVVDGMHRNLIPTPGFVGSRGQVIKEPKSWIFFYNGNCDLVFQREEEFHLATIAQLIRQQSDIQRGNLEAEEMIKN
ncbi:hypothetical protein Tco_0688925 [Tanacetum coccineum]